MQTGSNRVVVIGGGLAGMVAAARATELGLKAVVLEAGSDADYICNSRMTGGIFHVAMNNILVEPEEARANILVATGGHSDGRLVDALAGNARRAVDWLRSQGIRFIRGGPTPEFSTVLAPPMLQQFGLHWRGRGGDVLLRTLAERMAAGGGKIVRGARASSLRMANRRCVGVEAECDGRLTTFDADAVVIADGGFQANPDLVGEHISPAPDKVLQRNAKTGRGDGLRMAAEIGAKLVGLSGFYGHVLHRDAMFNDRLWPHPMVDSMAASGMIVGNDGCRFTDEGLGGVSIANAIARLLDPLSTVVICDDAAWQGPAKAAVLAPNPNLSRAGAFVTTASDISGLAETMGLPSATLVATVGAYNKAFADGSLDRLEPPRSSGRWPASSIIQPPFHAVPVCAGMTYTMGGIAIDDRARVIDSDGLPIPGLYAAGATTGGLEGGPLTGYTGGLSKASTFGLLAAEAAAEALGAQSQRAAS